MPLVRYEIRNEHSLANPQLYRTAAKDDPEGLLEGVAMAGLVGIVRQLGDLAEFAAEVFRDLHEEVMATASRGHELLARVQQLEAEMPAVEKALLSETNQLRFAYTPGAEWHAGIRNDQNHCTQGDLPRFIRNSYEECRGPPRLFLLDKFDVAGAGACLKRYTDPSFFRTEWASSELMKAERVQRDKKARREKKKGKRRRNVDGKESIPVDQYHTRFSHELCEQLTQPDQPHSRMWHQPTSQRSEEALSGLEKLTYHENLNALSRHLAEAEGLARDATRTSDVALGSGPEAPLANFVDVPAVSGNLTSCQSMEGRTVSTVSIGDEDVLIKWEKTGHNALYKGERVLQAQQEAVIDVCDEGATESEQFLDALTTMESDSDSEPRLRQDRHSDSTSGTNAGESTVQDGSRSPGLHQILTAGKVTLLVQQSPRLTSVDISMKDLSRNSTFTASREDVKEPSSPKSIVRVRRLSTDSISSRMAKLVQPLDEPWESFVARLKPDSLKDETVGSKSSERRAVSSLSAGVKVSKMVAAFEAGSLPQIHDEELELEPQGLIKMPTVSEEIAESADQASAIVNDAGVCEDHKSDNNFLQDSDRPFLASPGRAASTSTKGLCPIFHACASLRRVAVEGATFSSQLSLGSLESPPNSPRFSALQSPISPMKTTRDILSSPDSHTLGFSTELLSPGSPTSVPVLALSPTSKKVPPSFFSLGMGHCQTLQSPNSLLTEEQNSCTFPPSSLVQLPSTLRTEEPSESTPPMSLNVIYDSAAPLLTPAEDSNGLISRLPARTSHDLPIPTPPILSSHIVSPVMGFLDDFEELHVSVITEASGVCTSTAAHEVSTLPTTQTLDYNRNSVLSPSQPMGDGIAVSSTPNDYSPDNRPTIAEGRAPLESILTLASAPPSASLHNFMPPILSQFNQAQSPPSSLLPALLLHDTPPPILSVGKAVQPPLSLPSKKSYATASWDLHAEARGLPIPIAKAIHKPFPSSPPSQKTTQDTDSASLLISKKDPSASAVPLKAAPVAQIQSPKFVQDLQSSMQRSLTLHEIPLRIPESSHRQFPSFASPRNTTLELAPVSSSKSSPDPPTSSAVPSEPVPDDQILPSKSVHDLRSPSRPLYDLPPPTPPSKSGDNFLPPQPLPSRTANELHPPPQPLGHLPPSPAKPSAVDVQDALLEAISSHDKSTLKKVKTMQNTSLRKGDGRSHLLEQIRAQSFNLRHTVVEKVDPPLPRPMTNINVAAILEKANAIRQAFAGSDEDDDDNDDWSDV